MATYQAGAVLEALGDPTRRTIFEMLGEGPTGGRAARAPAAGQPAGRLATPQGAEAGGRGHRPRAGTQRIYEIDRDGLAELRAYLDDIWTNALDAFKHAAEAAAEEDA